MPPAGPRPSPVIPRPSPNPRSIASRTCDSIASPSRRRSVPRGSARHRARPPPPPARSPAAARVLLRSGVSFHSIAAAPHGLASSLASSIQAVPAELHRSSPRHTMGRCALPVVSVHPPQPHIAGRRGPLRRRGPSRRAALPSLALVPSRRSCHLRPSSPATCRGPSHRCGLSRRHTAPSRALAPLPPPPAP